MQFCISEVSKKKQITMHQSMNPNTRPCAPNVPAFVPCLVALVVASVGHAQAVVPPPAAAADQRAPKPPVVVATPAGGNDETVELSPFVVKGETGWNATETLAGTRMKTSLKDVPNQLEVFTKEFMDDLALNNVDDIVIYAGNVDSLDEYMQDNNAENGATNLTKKTRVRGLNQASFSRGFFGSSFQSDSYNTDSTTVASGSNPVLFGLGSSAGIIDSSAGRAAMRNRMNVRLQYSSEDSKRATLNLNRVIIPSLLALRVDGLWSEYHTSRKPNYDDQQRYTIGLAYKPFKTTTVYASYEHISRDGNIAPRNLAMDRVSLWELAPSVPLSPYRTARPGYDNRTAVPANISTTSRIFGTQSANNAVFISDAAAVAPMNWGRSVTVLNPTAATAFGVPDADYDRAAQLELSFMDGKYFPADANIVGNLRKTTHRGDIKTLNLEQRLRRNLFVELAYNREDFTQSKLLNISQVKIFVDPNLYLPVALPGETAPRPNPNHGLQYFETAPNGFWTHDVNENLRATASYELNAPRELKYRWARWLGAHRLAGIFERAQAHEIRLSGGIRSLILDDPFIPGINLTPRTTQNWATNASRSPLIRAYFPSRGANVAGPGGQGVGWTYVDANGKPGVITYGDAGMVSATSGKRLSTSNNPPDTTARKINSVIFAWQGSFLPDREGNNRIILNYGRRRDSIRTATADAASRTRDFSGLYPMPSETTWDSYGAADEAVNSSRGVVVRPWRWVSFFYNKSTTFAPVGRAYYDPYGNAYPGSGGEGRDYGVRFDLWKDRVSLRYNRFESSDGPTVAPPGRLRNIIGDARLIENRVLALDPSLPQINLSNGIGVGFPGSAPLYMPMSFREAQGDELSLSARPTPNWNIVLNAAKSKAIDSEIGIEWKAWVQERLPVWQRVVARNGEVDNSGRPATWATALADPGNSSQTLQQYYEGTVVGETIAFMNASEGKQTDGSRGRRANLISSYRFSEGKLKGLSLTGALRWRPPPTIGYPVKRLPSGVKALDVDNPWRGKRELWTDVGVGYRGRIAAFGGLRYNAQLNVRNVFGEGPLIPFRSYTDGTIASVATLEPRLFIFTWGLEF